MAKLAELRAAQKVMAKEGWTLDEVKQAVEMTPNTQSKKYYAICHRKDGVNGASVSVGGIMAGDDLDSLSERLETMIWRRNNRPTIARIYLTSTEELVKTIAL